MTRGVIDIAVYELTRDVGRLLAGNVLRDADLLRLEQWLKYETVLLRSPVALLVTFVRHIVEKRRIDAEALSMLATVRKDLAPKTSYRSIAVKLQGLLGQCERVTSDSAHAAYEREIIRLIESGATVNGGIAKLRVIHVRTDTETVKAIALDTHSPVAGM